MFLTKQPGQIALSRADTTNQTDYRNSSRSIRQAEESESGGERPWTAWAFEERNIARPAAVVTLYDADRFLVSQGQNGKTVPAESGRLQDLQRRRLDQVFDARPIFLHVGSDKVGLQRRQIA